MHLPCCSIAIDESANSIIDKNNKLVTDSKKSAEMSLLVCNKSQLKVAHLAVSLWQLKVMTERLMALRYKLRKFDIPIDDSCKVCVDKKSVVKY